MVSQREMDHGETHQQCGQVRKKKKTTAHICSRKQWLCERDGNSRVHCVICRSVGLRRTTRHQFTSTSFPLHNGAITSILDACSAPCSFQSNDQRFRSLRSCKRTCAGKEITTAGHDWTPVSFLVPFLSFCTARDTCFRPHDATIRHYRPAVPDGKGCGSRLRRQHESGELIPSP